MDGDSGKQRDLRERTKEFALRIVRLYAALPKTTEAQVLGKRHVDRGQLSRGDPSQVNCRIREQGGSRPAGTGRDRLLA